MAPQAKDVVPRGGARERQATHVSDRRRIPPRDDWDDELELGEWERPAEKPRASSRRPYDRAPDQAHDPLDDLLRDRPREPERRRELPPRDYPGRTGPPVTRSRYTEPVPEPGYRPRRAPYDPTDDDLYGAEPEIAEDYGEWEAPPTPRKRPTGRRAPAREAHDVEFGEEFTAPPARRRRDTLREEPRRKPRGPAVSVPRPAVNDNVAVGAGLLALLSVVFMVATVAAGTGDLADWIPIHLDSAGNADRWGSPDVLWRLPFGAFMVFAMSAIVAILLWKRDRFASRFVLVGTALVQIVAWVALIDHIW
jgi:hypothetical protein